MKLSTIIIFIFILLEGTLSNLFAQNLVGPEILGFRLGMTIEQIDIVASTHHYRVRKSVTYSDDHPRFDILEQDNDISTLSFGFRGKDVNEMIFGPKSFNTTKIDENFILKFLQHYKIPVDQKLVKETRDDLIIPVPNEGYEVIFNTKFGGYIKILRITKSSDINFR